jgi:predicted DNA-binding transcriptional regulator AlpA
MSTVDTPCLVYFAEDVCRALGISRSTLKRLRRFRAFPIPELPALDNRPRWSRAAVEAFVEARADQGVTRFGRHARTVVGRSVGRASNSLGGSR